jgi:hypothetical protein
MTEAEDMCGFKGCTAIMIEAHVLILAFASLLLSSNICRAEHSNGETMFVSSTLSRTRLNR